MPDPESISASTLVTDREGKILRAFLTPEGAWRFRANLDRIDPVFLDALLRIEDKRFEHHFGVDPLAVARAVAQLIRSGSTVSGASTITMQVARLLNPRPRTIWSKIVEATRALTLELRLEKRQILELYLTLAPYGGNLQGIRAATLAYFGKEPAHLTASETALLIAIPQSPEARRPDRHSDIAQRERNAVLRRLAALGIIDDVTHAIAEKSTIPSVRRKMPFSAPHLARRLTRESRDVTVRTTIDAELQKRIEQHLQVWLAGQERHVNAAVIVAEITSGAVRAHIGSADFFDNNRAGQVDLSRAIRSPGSTLKPFIYAMAIEDGLLDPRTIVVDSPRLASSYNPDNFAGIYSGEITAAEALRNSLNQPAVQLLERLGPERFMGRLKRAGSTPVLPNSAERPGLAIALGGIGLTLENLVSLYTALGTDGQVRPLTFRSEGGKKPLLPLLDPGPAWEVQNILSEMSGSLDQARRVAWKTGTSYGYRDAWSIGLIGGGVVGVWVGRPDGTPRPGYYGRNTAAPLLFDVASLLPEDRALSERPPPEHWSPMRNGPLPAALQFFPPRPVGAGTQPAAFSINLPLDGTVLDLADSSGMTLTATGGRRPFVWLVNEKRIPAARHRRDAWWEPRGSGFFEIVALDADGRAARALVEVKDVNFSALSQ